MGKALFFLHFTRDANVQYFVMLGDERKKVWSLILLRRLLNGYTETLNRRNPSKWWRNTVVALAEAILSSLISCYNECRRSGICDSQDCDSHIHGFPNSLNQEPRNETVPVSLFCSVGCSNETFVVQSMLASVTPMIHECATLHNVNDTFIDLSSE